MRYLTESSHIECTRMNKKCNVIISKRFASPRRGRGATAARGGSSRSLLPGVAAADVVRAADVDHVIIGDHGCHAERLHRDFL